MRQPFFRAVFLRLSLAFFVAFGSVGLALAQAASFPELIPLPDGFAPEGVTLGTGHDLYAGSLGDGSVVKADLRTGSIELVVPPQAGGVAVGLAFDRRSNTLWVAGGPLGSGSVYDAATGAELARYDFGGVFVNDVVVTRDAVWFTDSFAAFLYRVPLGPGGRLPAPAAAEAVPLSGDFVQSLGFNLNGIDATADGRWLVVVHSNLGELYRVDPRSGEATAIDLGESVPNGDGLVLEGRTLYVVQNQQEQILVVELGRDLTTGTVVDLITSPYFDIPTTAAGFGAALYAVNARFGTPPTPQTTYEIVRVLK